MITCVLCHHVVNGVGSKGRSYTVLGKLKEPWRALGKITEH